MASKYGNSRHFASMAAFVDHCGSIPVENQATSRHTHRAEWQGTATYEDAAAMAHGWQDGARMIERVKATLKVKTSRTRNTTAMAVTGPGSLSMGNLMAGHPAPYVVFKPTNQVKRGRGKVVKVLVNVSASGMVSTEVIERRGAAVVALIDALENAGRRVEVTGVMAITPSARYGSTGRLEYRIDLKRAESRLNLASLAFALAHPSMLRRFCFAAVESENADNRQMFGAGGSYGIPADVTPEEGTIYLGRMHGLDRQWDAPETAAEWVRTEAAKQGVKIG